MRPRELPQARSDLQAGMRAAVQQQPAQDGEEMRRCLAATQVAELYWVAEPMTDLAVAAADTVPENALDAPDLLPSEAGLLIWAGGLPEALRVHSVTSMAPTGALWLRRAGDVDITWLADPCGLPRAGRFWKELVPVAGGIRASELLPWSGSEGNAMRTLAATWLLMGQPVVAHRQRLDVRAKGGAARRRRDTTGVTTVDLRAIYQPQLGDGEQVSSRDYRHRWVVRGHWRQQAYGPGWSLRRPTWIAAFEKGPDDAPLVVTEKVIVWRR